MVDCIFCKEISGNKITNFSKLYPKMKNRILYQTKNFILIPCLGQLSYGHSMIIPKKHCVSIKNAINDFGINEIEEIISLYRKFLLKENYKYFFIYEHGNHYRKIQNNSCIEHAHLNIIPLYKIDGLMNMISNKKPNYTDINKIYQKIKLNQSYLLYGLYNMYYSFEYIQLDIYQSQYFRKILASFLNNKEWDWVKYGKQDILIDFVKKFRNING